MNSEVVWVESLATLIQYTHIAVYVKEQLFHDDAEKHAEPN